MCGFLVNMLQHCRHFKTFRGNCKTVIRRLIPSWTNLSTKLQICSFAVYRIYVVFGVFMVFSAFLHFAARRSLRGDI